VLALVAFGLLALAVWRPFSFARLLTRRERLWWLATTLLCAALIASLKRGSTTSCPWSLAEFGGGMAHYMPHWALGQGDGGPGGCFPSGHASIAFSLLAGCFVLRPAAPGAALAWLLLCSVAGIALGWVQMMRGAHYLSHALWTAWICWAVTAASFHATLAWRQGSTRQAASGNDGASPSRKS
jgi:membrane-associated PAP2 superfamily phosphatase